MTPHDSAVDALAARTREALAAPPSAQGPGQQEPAVGSAADGLVRATAGADGRLRSLTIDPVMFKQPLVEVTAAACAAVNAALDQVAGDPDYSPVVDLVRDTQSQVRRDLGRVSAAMAEVAQHIRTRPEREQF